MSGALLAEFTTARDLAMAAREAAEAGHPAQDALCATPVKGVTDYLSPAPSAKPIGWVMFAAGVVGALAGYFIQWYSAVIDYPIHSGGRPLDSWPAFLLVPFETAILSAAVIGILGWLWMCGLPKLFHPLFEAAIVERANQDRYLLVFAPERGLAAWVQANLNPACIHENDA